MAGVLQGLRPVPLELRYPLLGAAVGPELGKEFGRGAGRGSRQAGWNSTFMPCSS
ncbi:hypothetical protein ACFWNQ_10410 [Streptomyces virginiae]|uniref:hypothetical protein n=1 Tax=Streptomyces virginiae TaxID=1961 RepID=UPI00364964B0